MMNQSIIMNMPGNSNISGSIKEYLEKIIDNDKKNWINNIYTELQAKEIIPVSLRLVERKEHEQTVFDVSELVKKENKLIISGGSGSGKTITLKWLNVIYANRYLKDEESKIPIYIALNLYNKGTFHDYVRKNVRNNGLSESAFDSLLKDNKIIFLIDGLDLLSSQDQFNPYSEIWDFITDQNDCRYVVSSRPGFFGRFERFAISELEGLDPEKIGLFIDKYAQDNRICEPLKNKILGDEKLKSLFSNPLMLYLAIKVASTQKKDEILPSKRSQMYMEFIHGMFEHDSSKMPQGYRLHSNEQQMLETITDIYFYIQCKNESSMDYSHALEIASKHSVDKRYKPVGAESILEDIFTVGLIPKNNSIITYGIHQSFQEYFSALKLKEYFEKGFDVSEAFRHPKWEEVVLFASEMFDSPDDFVGSMINVGELHLASKCAQNTGNDIKEDLCIRLAGKYDSRFLLDKTKAIESLSRFGELAISVIIAALHHENVNLRWKAAVALGEIKTEKAVDLLIAALSDDNNIVRWMVAIALGIIKSEKAVDLLIAKLSNENENIPWEAVIALGKIKSEKAVDALIAALSNENENVRWNAADVLGKIKSEKAVDALIAVLSDENRIVLWKAVDALGEIKSEKGVDALIAALSHENEVVRNSAAYALGKIKSEKAVDALKAALRNENEDVRRSVTYAMDKINSEKEEYAGHSYEGMHRRAMFEKSDNEVLVLIETLHNENEERRVNAAFVLGEICKIRHEGVLKKLAEESKNEFEANAAYEILQKIKLHGYSETKLFQKKPAKIKRGKKSDYEKVVTAQSPETGAQDPYFHIAVNKISEIRNPTVIVDYGCGYGKLLTPMKNLGADVLDNIHYIGVDAKTACLLKSCWTAEKYGLFKNEPEFMTPQIFFKKNITVDFALFMHTLHEIRLVDLVDSIYHITAKLPVGGQIFILEPGSYIVEKDIEERNYVLWKDTDFKMIFSNHGFDVMPYPITTNKGAKLNAVNIIKVQNENFPKETVANKCLLMFESKKKELYGMLNNNHAGSENDKKIDLLYSYVSSQIDEYKEILNI